MGKQNYVKDKKNKKFDKSCKLGSINMKFDQYFLLIIQST